MASIRLGLRDLPLTADSASGVTARAVAGLDAAVEVINAIALGNPSRITNDAGVIAGVTLTPRNDEIEFTRGEESCTVARQDVLSALEQLMEVRGGLAANWMLRPDPIFWRPSSLDRFDAADLEERVVTLDERIAAGTPEAELRATRQWLMPELERRGLFSQTGIDDRIAILEELACPILAGYARAATQLHEYFASENRAKIFRERPAKILGSRVSIDWFRRQAPIPEGVEPVKWLTLCEFSLMNAQGHPQLVIIPGPGGLYRLEWQADDGVTAAALRATPQN
jgi:hypothetical protein